MQIVERSQNLLILRRKPWVERFELAIVIVWSVVTLALGAAMIWSVWPDIWSNSGTFLIPLFGFVAGLFASWEISVCLDRKADEVNVHRRRMLGVSRKTYPLSDLRSITFDECAEYSDVTLKLNFGSWCKTAKLPTKAHSLFQPANSSVETLIDELIQWSELTGSAEARDTIP